MIALADSQIKPKPCKHLTIKLQKVGLQHYYICEACRQKFDVTAWDGKVEVIGKS